MNSDYRRRRRYSGSMPTPRLLRNVPLGPYTTFGLGGPADLLTVPKSDRELADAVRWGRQEKLPVFVLGTGANILVGDKGFRGLVVKSEAVHYSFDGNRLTAESGITIAKLIDESAKRGLSGLEHYQDIPSSLGGAMWQNLHFLGYPHKHTSFIAEIVCGATVLTGDEEKTVESNYFKFGYDTSILHQTDDVVLTVTLELVPAPKEEIALRRRKNSEWRAAKHPPGAVQMSAGSIFQKIEKVGAGRLVDRCGLKGHRIGGAQVSERHANYILNVDHAMAADVRQLIAHIQAVVKKETGHQLKPEISFIGDF